MTKKDINEFVKKLEGAGVIEIKSIWGNFEPPRKLAYKNTMRLYPVDIEIIYKNHKDYYAIERNITKAQIPDLIAKWILFSRKAKDASGHFYVVVDETNMSKCQHIIDDKLLDVELMAI